MSGSAIAWSLLATTLGFLVGFSVGQGSTCAVTAGKELVFAGRARLLAGFLIASGVAGMLCLPLAWTLGMRAGLPPDAPIDAALVFGALLLAAGALVNDACLFGTLARIAQGEVRFLAVPVGLAIGYVVAAGFVPDAARLTPNLFRAPSLAPMALVGVSAVIVAGAWFVLGRGGDTGDVHRWPLRVAMVALGGAGALLFVLAPGWTYADAVRRGAFLLTGRVSPHMAVFVAAVTGVATLAGAIVAGVSSRRFHFQRPRMDTLARSLAGGALMAAGAGFVPGGNDTLLLWAVPGGSVSGLVAYIVMTATIIAALFALRLLGRAPA